MLFRSNSFNEENTGAGRDGKEGMLKAAIEAFFEKEGMTVTFSDHCEIISPGCRTVSMAACQ